MVFNHQLPVTLHTLDGSKLEIVQDFKYLGSLTQSTEANIMSRKAAAWKACNKLKNIWKAPLGRSFKLRLFLAVLESVLLYGSEAWTLTKTQEKQLDSCYTCLLHTALNVNWEQHMTNEELYGSLPRLSTKLAGRRLQFAGHCFRQKEEGVSKLVLWKPTHGHKSRGRPATTYLDQLTRDLGLIEAELPTMMSQRDTWQGIIG